MLRYVTKKELPECLEVIHAGFATVAAEYGLTRQNAPTNGAFMEYDRLASELERCEFMVCEYKDGKIAGFASLVKKNDDVFELDKLSVIPQARHFGTGRRLVTFCAGKARARGGKKLVLGMINENMQLKQWYGELGFKTTGTRVFEHLPFTVGFMELELTKRCVDIPEEGELLALAGKASFNAFNSAVAQINSIYDIPAFWNGGGKKWLHEYKFRRGGKTLCAFYTQTGYIGCMFVLGAAEQAMFEARRDEFSAYAQGVFDSAVAYHDGKWLMLDISDANAASDMLRLLTIKHKPNKKKISCCGVVCSACEYYPLDCAGCFAVNGKPFWLSFTGGETCEIFDCCVNQNKRAHCGGCRQLPCQRYRQGDPTKSPEENAAILKRQLKILKTM